MSERVKKRRERGRREGMEVGRAETEGERVRGREDGRVDGREEEMGPEVEEDV